MKRISILSILALLATSACDSDTIISSLDPEMADPAFAKAEIPLFQPPTECPGVSCLLGPVTIDRLTKAPAVYTETFSGVEGQEATLVVMASNPKTTTIKVWLNELVVLLPSQLPQSGSNEVRVPVTLAEENVLEARLSAKPGTQVVLWVESDEEPQDDSGGPVPTVFQVTTQSFPFDADLSSACSEFGEGHGMADWNDVVQAVNDGFVQDDILSSGLTALVLYNGVGLFNTGFPFFQNQHYVLSAAGPDLSGLYDSIGTDMFWLNSTTFSTPVLCLGPDGGGV